MQIQMDNAIVGRLEYHCTSITRPLFADLLSSSPPDGITELMAITNARRLYASCVNEEAIEVDDVNVILSFVDTELGGWPILEGSGWNESTFDFFHLLLKLSQYNNFLFYDVDTTIHEMNSSVNCIQVSR
jgi:hypothetical protein